MQAKFIWTIKRIFPLVAGLSGMFAWHYWKWDGLLCVIVGSTPILLLFALIVRKGSHKRGDKESV
jgi:membrane protein DedA with SNARE-associated domain